MTPEQRSAAAKKAAATRAYRKATAPIRVGPYLVWRWDERDEEWVLEADGFFFVRRDSRDPDTWSAWWARERHAKSWSAPTEGWHGHASAAGAREAVHERLRSFGYQITKDTAA